jgi:putative hydrolase of the HAD superfamily
MLKAVAFDLWETLITDTPELSRQQERLRLVRMEETLTTRGHADLAQRLETAYRAIWPRCQELYWSADQDIPCRRQIEHLVEELGLDPATFDEAALAELERAYAYAAVEVLPAEVDGAVATLRSLKELGFGIGLISNTGRTPGYALRDILEALGLAPAIDVMVFSNEHGACKPQYSIFETLRAGLGVASGEIVFVGDNLYVDVHGAQRFGMRAIHFEPPVRGTAIAPPVDHGLEIQPDARVTRLEEIVPIVREWR